MRGVRGAEAEGVSRAVCAAGERGAGLQTHGSEPLSSDTKQREGVGRMRTLTLHLVRVFGVLGFWGFRGSGWTFSDSVGSQLDRIKPQKSGPVTVYGRSNGEGGSGSSKRLKGCVLEARVFFFWLLTVLGFFFFPVGECFWSLRPEILFFYFDFKSPNPNFR